MKKILILFLFVAILNAKNPLVYASLGDVIYDNLPKIENLKNLEEYSVFNEKIDVYVQEVNALKKYGFLVENGDSAASSKVYLEKLRELSKTNDFFVRSAKMSYMSAIENENSPLFSSIINSGLIDVQANKSQIKEYYFAHSDDINATGVIQSFLDEDALLLQKNQPKQYKSKKETEAEKIRRIREKDKERKEAIKRSLEEEVSRKKAQILQEQVRELAQ
jgi:hypothetical protein